MVIEQRSMGTAPTRITLVDLAPPRPTLAINAVWSADDDVPTVGRFLEVAAALTAERGWQ